MTATTVHKFGGKVGEIKRVTWYELEPQHKETCVTRTKCSCNGLVVSFHTAFQTRKKRANGSLKYSDGVVFYSTWDNWPSLTAQALGLSYEFMRNSTNREVANFLEEHGDIKVKRIIEK